MFFSNIKRGRTVFCHSIRRILRAVFHASITSTQYAKAKYNVCTCEVNNYAKVFEVEWLQSFAMDIFAIRQ